MIEVQNLSKMHKNRLTLNNLCFNVKPGIITGFLGPNGAGKSTTIRSMVQLDSHEGKVLFSGYEYNQIVNPMRQVGVMLDAKIFHPNRKAIDHLKMYANAIGVDITRINQVISMVGLGSVIGNRAGTYSLGMAQRLSIAVALLGDPNFVILDEPANGLDPDGIYWLRNLLKELAAMGKVVFLSSHLLNEVAQLADHVLVIGQGQILADKSLKDLMEENSSKQVFIRIQDPHVHFEKFSKLEGIDGFEREGDGILIKGTSTDVVSAFLVENGIVALELTQREATLEQVYMNITKSNVEFTPFNNNSGGL